MIETAEIVETPEVVEAVATDIISETELLTTDDQVIIDETLTEITNAYQQGAEELILKIGKIILNKIFENDIGAATDINNSKSTSIKQKLFSNLIDGLVKLSSTGRAPKKSWLYNALNLAIAHDRLNPVTGYDKLSVSHKIELLSVKDDEKQKNLISKINEENLTIKETKLAVKTLKGSVDKVTKPPTVMSIVKKPRLDVNLDDLQFYGGEKRKKTKKQIAVTTKRINDEIEKKRQELDQLKAIGEKLDAFGR